MSDEADLNREIVIKRLMKRLEGFAVGIGLDQEELCGTLGDGGGQAAR
ncbi:hypothetical protein INQ30_24255 [Escherichia coli]|jgi:hypothetical protein|nr:hypothetical protein [Escherichia coli]